LSTKILHAEKFDVVVIGAGIFGLSTGLAILEGRPHSKVLLLEKEDEIGLHASGRNSGVMHSGFYYSPDSLKARFCRDGNFELKRLCNKTGIPFLTVGKVVVAQNEDEVERLHALYERGIANNVEVELMSEGQLKTKEPLAKTFQEFLWSPTTAVSSPMAVLHALKQDFLGKGGQIRTGENVKEVTAFGEITTVSGTTYIARHVVNAAGAYANRIAHSLNVGLEYLVLPFLGIYKTSPISKLPLRTLVYPVPHPVNPFLGVHFTISIDGLIKVGPTAIPVIGREQYSIFDKTALLDFFDSMKASRALLKEPKHSLFSIAKTEFSYLNTKHLVSEASKLVPSAKSVSSWQKKRPGIRAQLVNRTTGELVQDFIVKSGPQSTHILNAVSPGWTSALPFGRWVIEEYVSKSI
jgi:L-2-hydroxyglutarate oxidase